MAQIVVLTGKPGKGAVTHGLSFDLATALRSAGAETSDVRVLSLGTSIEVPFDGLPNEAASEVIAQFAEDVPVDFNIVGEEGRRKKLLIADMDSTIITAECIDEIADFAGVKDQISTITERAMRGELEFEGALRERVALLKGLDVALLPKVFEERIELTSGARALVSTMKSFGAFTALISGGFTFFTSRVAEAAGFQFNQANTLLEEDGKLNGKVSEPILGQDAKKAALIKFRDQNGLGIDETLAVGDGANDLSMINEAGLGVAFRAKPVVADAAEASITHGDLTALLYLQGYTDEEIVKG